MKSRPANISPFALKLRSGLLVLRPSENYTEERIKERIAGRTPRRNRRQTVPKGISLIGDIQERIRLIDSKGYEYKAKLAILKEAARTLNYLTENNLLQYADLEKKVEDIHSSYDRTGKELKGVEARLREVQPLIKNISNYQRLKPVYDAFQKAKDKPGFKAKHEAELVIFEATRSTLLAMQGDEKLPSLKTLKAEQAQLFEEQERLYAERNRLKKEAKQIETIKSNVDTFLAPSADHDRDHLPQANKDYWLSSTSSYWGNGAGSWEVYNNSWTPERTDAKFPMYGSGTGSYPQTGYLLDASYIKLKQVILGYTFPRALINKIGLEKLRLNLAAYNLFTISDMPKYYDADYLSDAYPPKRTFSVGIQVGF